MYADDLCLVGNSAKDLQLALHKLETYCDLNNLTVNTEKTKLLVFHKGRLPKFKVCYKSKELERVNEFNYLGFTLSSQMSFSAHIQSVVTKSDARIGALFSRLKLQKMSLSTIIRVFMCYIQPLFEYGLIVWITGKFSLACNSAHSVGTRNPSITLHYD